MFKNEVKLRFKICDSGVCRGCKLSAYVECFKKCEELMLVEHQFPLYFKIILELIGTDEIG